MIALSHNKGFAAHHAIQERTDWTGQGTRGADGLGHGTFVAGIIASTHPSCLGGFMVAVYQILSQLTLSLSRRAYITSPSVSHTHPYVLYAQAWRPTHVCTSLR